jgi:tetratricopeptide (TPR) repeat protein
VIGGSRIGGSRIINNPTAINQNRITNINRNSNFTNINRGSSFNNINRGSRFASIDRGPRFATQFNRFSRPWWGHHHGWYRGTWWNWPYYPACWAALGGAYWLTPWAVGTTFVYANPYWVAPSYVVPALDYSEPIPVPTDSEMANTSEDTVADAMSHFTHAGVYFKEGRYEDANAEVDAGLQLLPSDRTMHEFRALILFARGMYDQAAAAIYAVLAQGPGWDWNTMAALYDNSPETYTAQLRALEAYVLDHSRDAASRFLLAYQYLVIDDRGAALSQLRPAVKLRPDDKLSAQLIDALTRPPQREVPQ